jgi:hypothetical protein
MSITTLALAVPGFAMMTEERSAEFPAGSGPGHSHSTAGDDVRLTDGS